MRINQRTCSDNRTLAALIEQVSALQNDVGRLDNEIDNLDLSKANAEALKEKVETKDVDALKATIGTATVSTLHASEADGAKAHFTSIIGDTLDATNGDIDSLSSNVVEAVTVEADEVRTIDLAVTGGTTLGDVTVANIEASNINVNGLSAKQGTIDSIVAKTIGTEKLVADKADIAELSVHGGSIEGVTVDAESVKAVKAELDKIKTASIVMSDINELRPSGTLGISDRFTIELPTFTGTYYLVWKDTDVIWSAVVTGNGCDYSISWNVVDKNNIAVTDFFQYNNKAYIRTSANGALYYVYNATQELEAPWIYFNMNQWEKEPLEVLCDERHQYHTEETRITDGTIAFGSYYILSLVNTEKGELADEIDANKVKVYQELEIVPKTITWHDRMVTIPNSFNTDWVL